MTEYMCARCHYTTQWLSNFKKHLNRQHQCQALFSDTDTHELLKPFTKTLETGYTFKCEHCSKLFKTQKSCNQHSQRCPNKPKENEQNINNQISNPTVTNTVNNSPNTQINNTQINNNVNHVIINIKSFGQENLSYLEQDKSFLTNCLLSRDIKTLIENIHCDKDHPENHNVRIRSTKQELMETYIDGGWIISDQDETLDELLNKGYRVLRLHSHRNKNEIKAECDDDEDEYDSLMSWLEDVYDDKKVRKPIKRQLLILFMNRKTMLLEREIY